MPGERVLVVDDEPAIVDVSSEVLQLDGYHVNGATSPREALELLQDGHWDVLLTDIVMPAMTGLELLDAATTRNPDLIGIIMTGHGTLDTAIESLRLGAQGFVLKPFSPDEIRSAVSRALERRRLERENARLRALLPLFRTGRALTEQPSLPAVLDLIVETMARDLESTSVWLLLQGQDGGDWSLAGNSHDEPDPTPPSHHALRQLLVHLEPVALEASDRRQTSLFPDRPAAHSHLLLVPLVSLRHELIGGMILARACGQPAYADGEMEQAAIQAGQAASSIQNAWLYQELEESYVSLVVSLANALEARDPGTGAHCQNLASYAAGLGLRLGLESTEIDELRMGALLHDVGKIGVPDSILLKPGPLTDQEFELIKRHPDIGADIIGGIRRLEPISRIVRAHHERIDGNGYPSGLTGDQIPFNARVIAVVDTYIALTEDRPYRSALSSAEAFEVLRQDRGTRYQDTIVDAFIAYITEGRTIPGR